MSNILFSVTAKDLDFSYTKGTGAGGQKRNKTSSAVHCTHKASGAHAFSQESRSQHDNKKDAFVKMTETKEFQDWLKIETARLNGTAAQIDAYVEVELKKAVIEVKRDGKWTKVREDELTN
jgi:peptide chain release factor